MSNTKAVTPRDVNAVAGDPDGLDKLLSDFGIEKDNLSRIKTGVRSYMRYLDSVSETERSRLLDEPILESPTAERSPAPKATVRRKRGGKK